MKRSICILTYNYLKHFIKGKSCHGIHSPFMYNLLKNCIYYKNDLEEFELIEEQRKKLKTNNNYIKVNDFGSKTKAGICTKKTSSIAKKSLKSPKQAALLHNIAKYFECKSILELGTCFGITTSYLSKAQPNANINTIEGCPQTASVAYKVFKSLNLNNIELHIGKIDELLIPILNKNNHPDFIFIDANHTQPSTIKYFNAIKNYIKDDLVIIIDDIHYSKEMEKAWHVICNDSEVSVTIDLFYMGLVFFKKGLSKENFKIRYY